MELTLHHPMKISARLLPAVVVADTWWISIEPSGVVNDRITWNWYVDRPGTATWWGGGDLSSGVGTTDNEDGYRSTMSALLSFLMDAAEHYRHDSDYEDDVFPTSLVHWAYQHDDELGMLQVELEGGE